MADGRRPAKQPFQPADPIAGIERQPVMPPGFLMIFVMDAKFSLSNVVLLNCRLVEYRGKTALDHREGS